MIRNHNKHKILQGLFVASAIALATTSEGLAADFGNEGLGKEVLDIPGNLDNLDHSTFTENMNSSLGALPSRKPPA